MTNKVIISGYSETLVYNGTIQYRNFSPDILAPFAPSNANVSLFTLGSFAVTTNIEPKNTRSFITNKFSNFVSLSDLDLTLEASADLLTNNAGVILNLDKTDLTTYALFGSLVENLRVALEDIITTWPAALYVSPVFAIAPDYLTQTGYTIENYLYNNISDTSSFRVNVTTINNKFQINFLQNGSLTNTINQSNTLRNLALNYQTYSILFNNTEYDILNFTGSTSLVNDYLYFVVEGNVFSGQAPSDYVTYYIKPNKVQENLFYNGLPDFEAYLLNRVVVPKFTSTFNYTVKSDAGNILYVSDTITWPTTDGYNLDFDTDAYTTYANKLLDISTDFDTTTSSLMTRFLVTESITDFDTTDVHLDPLDEDTSDQKVTKLLTIYGVEFDKINNFIEGIKFANTVSYDKNNNTPDIYLKNLARVMGWDLVSSVLENDLLTSYIQPKTSTYSGQTVGLTAIEADVELWRRIILNTPWLWKSKGTRKAIEFLFKFIGTPLGLISFNEYVYLAENKIDLNLFQEVLQLNGLDDNTDNYPISLSGYPQPLPDTPDVYFQGKGLWYRETAGDDPTIDITTGNNPHVGPYDGGFTYINQFRQLIPNFSAVTISSETTTTSSDNLFSNYNRGTMTEYSGSTYVDITTPDGVDFSNCYVVTPSIIQDPQNRRDQSNCGCETEDNLRSLSICIDKTQFPPRNCFDDIAGMSVVAPENYYLFNFNQYNVDGSIYMQAGSPVYFSSPFIDKNCCNFTNSVPYLWNQVDGNGVDIPFSGVNSGYICCQTTNTCGCKVTCKWVVAPERFYSFSDGTKYISFITEEGVNRLTSQDGCNCLTNFSIKVPIIDPLTGESGYGCQLTQTGLTDITSNSSVILTTYTERTNGSIGCSSTALIR